MVGRTTLKPRVPFVLIILSLCSLLMMIASKLPPSQQTGITTIRLLFSWPIHMSRWNEEMLRSAHLFFYLADEDGNALSLSGDILDIRENSLLALGSRMDVGGWQLHLESVDDLEVHYSGFRTPHIHNLSDLVQESLGEQVRKFGRLQLPDTSDNSPNILVFQISAKVPFKIEIPFLSGTGLKSSRVEERLNSLTGTSLTRELIEKQNEFDNKFEKCFNLTSKVDSESLIVGKAAIGNMLGGIGYFYGQSKISLPKNNNVSYLNLFLCCWLSLKVAYHLFDMTYQNNVSTLPSSNLSGSRPLSSTRSCHWSDVAPPTALRDSKTPPPHPSCSVVKPSPGDTGCKPRPPCAALAVTLPTAPTINPSLPTPCVKTPPPPMSTATATTTPTPNPPPP
ncbi:Mannosyl-oligosaccharide glucosidase GCS1 [Vitis vinifera]|uniref:Mannosyl-oligosaccharide glucosidase GCS1 n=1 Tax=Vitis vinifera TaxID=29760 RepID=A0A438CML2_VITVI|nr:Mannosyl-oligosaccharide glucosidase GCS1 [Vitis vinifera]